ncbi:hypothetical protein UG55_109716 [Frankia sp. EI5c]|nr:hypothetical protein UG55_109716 [Frankia sp. EI5c]
MSPPPTTRPAYDGHTPDRIRVHSFADFTGHHPEGRGRAARRRNYRKNDAPQKKAVNWTAGPFRLCAEMADRPGRETQPPRAATSAPRFTFVASLRGITSTVSTVLGTL